MKKIDTHIHTKEVSLCGHLTAEETVERYIAAGYDAIVITDHLIPCLREEWGYDKPGFVEYQLRGYRNALAAAQGRIAVWLGAEYRFSTGSEDFLIFGLDEQNYAELVYDEPDTPADLRAWLDARGALLYQAHPFRPGLKPADPAALHGVEVYNGNPRHNSHNDMALALAQQHGLRMLSGSDCHQSEDVARGGIMAPDSVDSNATLVEFLRGTPAPEMLKSE